MPRVPPPIANKVGLKTARDAPLGAARFSGHGGVVTPADQFVDSLAWAPGSHEIAYSYAPFAGFMAPYSTKIAAVGVDSGASRPIVDRAGMNVSPQYSPDGKRLSFITTNERTGLIAPRGLAVADAGARTRTFAPIR